MDLKFTCTTFRELAAPLLLDLNMLKSRILISTDGEYIIPRLAEVNPVLADKIEATIAELSVQKSPMVVMR